MRRVQHWTRIPPRELLDVLVAELTLLGAQLDVRRRPTGQLVRPWQGSAAVVPPAAERAAGVRRAVLAVDRASRFGAVRPACLARSLALARMLERHGVQGAIIRLGVRQGAAAPGGVDAHAWVELEGRVVGDDPRHTRHFTPIGSVASVERD